MRYRFRALAADIVLDCPDGDLMRQLQQIWPDNNPCPARPAQTQHYRVETTETGYRLQGPEPATALHTGELAELLHELDKAILIRLQQENPDLLFLHGATLHSSLGSLLVTGSSGAGKSSLCLALLLQANSPWSLLSDELAPLQVEHAQLYPYRRAIGLKSSPPDNQALPPGSLQIGHAIHVPISSLPATQDCPSQSRLRAIVSLNGVLADAYPAGARVSAADSALIILRNSLNSLAHPGNALPLAIDLAARVPCYNLPRLSMPQALQTVQQIWQDATS